MYLVYLFKEKKTEKIIYVGSSARPAERMKEHLKDLRNNKKLKIYQYMNENRFKFYKDVEIIWVDCANNKDEMHKLEEQYYFKYINTICNDRPGEDRKGEYNPKRRKVKCLNDGRTFNTVTECAKYYKKGRTTISNVLIKEKEYTWINGTKYYFKYVNKTCND